MEGSNSEFYTSGHARHAGQGYNWAQIYHSTLSPFFIPCPLFYRETDYSTRETYFNANRLTLIVLQAVISSREEKDLIAADLEKTQQKLRGQC